MRKYIVAVVILVVLGLGISFVLIPSANEVATLQQHDQVQVDIGNVDIEAEYAQGRRSLPIISALADKRVSEGNRPAAIALLEEYIAANPADAAGRKKLAEQYQLAGDGAKYNEQLEAIAAAEPNEPNLKVLSDVYNAGQLYDKQIETLQKLVEITKHENPQYLADLATILVVQNRKEEALKIVQEIKTKHPTFKSYAITRIEVGALTGNAQGDEAYQVAEAWMAGSITPNTAELADLTNILHYGGFAELAIKLVEPRISLIATDSDLVTAYVNANITAGRSDHAFDILTQIYNAGTMSAELYRPYLELALQRGDLDTAEKIVVNLKPEIFTEEQAINMLELARVQNAPDIAAKLLNTFNNAQYLASKPVLTAVVALGQNANDQDEKIATALQANLTSTMRVRLAEACYRADKTACTDEVIKGFPAIKDMTRAQVEEYSNLHIAIKRADQIVDAVAAEVVAGKSELSGAQIRLAAASGNEDMVSSWLLANGNNVAIADLQQLYYLANDNNKAQVASALATKLYERDPSPINREIIVAAYISAGDYEKALPIVRDNLGKTANANEQYLTVLTKLARTDADAKKELTDYAASVLATGTDNKAQISAAYTLLNNGQRQVALPYIKDFSTSRGGEWAVMWRQLNAATARSVAKPPVKLTREQRIQVANNPRSSEATKRQMAFDLINDGYRDDAAKIFQSLSANRGPDDQNVKDLLFLWGPKLNANEIGWLTARAKSSKNSYEQAKWNEYVNVYGDDNAVVQYVSTTPDALYNPDLRKKYFRSLASYGSRDIFDSNMRGWVAETTDVPALSDYAKIASAYGYSDAAANTLKRINMLAPNDADTLRDLSAISYSKGEFAQSQKYLTDYNNLPGSASDPQSASTYFYQALLYRRQNNTVAAKAEFQKVVDASANESALDSSARSQLYTSLMHLGQYDRAKQGFKALLAQNPDDKGVLADFMSVLIEYKFLDEATAIANQYDKNSPYYGQQHSMLIRSKDVASVERLSNGRELKISFNKPIDGKNPITREKGKDYAWLEKSRAGYNAVVVSAKPGYIMRFMPTSETTLSVVPVASNQLSPQEERARQQDLRLQLLYARIEQDSGQVERANQRLAALRQYYPQDPQLLTYTANVQSAAGNGSEALKLLQQAQSLSPGNEDIAAQINYARSGKSGAFATTQNFIKADYEYRGQGDSNEHIASLSGAKRVADNAELGFNYKHDIINAQNIRRGTDGRIGDYNANRDQAEIYAALLGLGTPDSRTQASFFINNDTAGAGLSYDFNNALGRSGLFGEYHRPYWDFVEAVLEDTTRDRVGIRHTAQLTPTTSFGLESSLNLYNTRVDEDVAESVLVRVSLAQQLRAANPYLGVGYGFDGEYIVGSHTVRSAAVTGDDYFLLPIRSREVHYLSGIVQQDLTPTTHAQLVGGYAFDRLNNDGPQVEGRITQDINDHLELGVRGRYGVESNNTNNSVTGAGAHLLYKF